MPSHRFPRLLTALQAIAEDVFTRYGLPAGRYKPLDSPAGQIDVLDHLRNMPPVAGLGSFEEEMLQDTKASL